MIITVNGEMRILNGSSSFESAIFSNKPKIRRKAIYNFFKAMRERGWHSNGNIRKPLPEFRIRPYMKVDQMYGQLATIMDSWKTDVKNIGKPDPYKPEREFWQHEATHQIIYVDELLAAAKLWPIDEVLELVDSTNQ